jgi:zinc/manganese transport system ATP-binding protein
VLSIKNASLSFDRRQLWTNLNLEVRPHEFIAIIGANGSGKTTLLKAILGQVELTEGSIELNGKKATRGSKAIGYIPQHRSNESVSPLRALDLLRFGLDGHRFGLPISSKKSKAKIQHILDCVDGHELARKKVAELSGGELQRLRVGQAVIGEPSLILADEPLSALDMGQQKTIANLLDQERREHNAAVLFVTHDVNPILSMVDRVLYLANGKFRIGTPDEVLRSEVLSELYETPVDVLRNQGRIVVVGTQDHSHHDHEEWS